jgi:hypothetical protein
MRNKKEERRNKIQDGERKGRQRQYRRFKAEVGEVPRQRQRHFGHQDMVPPNMSSLHSQQAGRQEHSNHCHGGAQGAGTYWALLLQDEKPASVASWKLLQPLLLERFDKVVNETQKFKLIAVLQQRQNESSKDFLDRCKTAWYGLLRKLRTKYTEKMDQDTHDMTRNECIKCMFICRMRNDIQMAVESIAGNTLMLETELTAAVQYESALMMGGGGGQKQGGAQRYGQIAAMQVTEDENAAAQASSPAAAGMQEMNIELAAIMSALAAIGAKKGGKGKPPGGAPPRGPRKQTGGLAGGAGTARSTGDAMGPQHARVSIKCYHCRQWGQHIAAKCTRTQTECDKLTPGAKLPPSGPARDSLFNPK